MLIHGPTPYFALRSHLLTQVRCADFVDHMRAVQLQPNSRIRMIAFAVSVLAAGIAVYFSISQPFRQIPTEAIGLYAFCFSELVAELIRIRSPRQRTDGVHFRLVYKLWLLTIVLLLAVFCIAVSHMTNEPGPSL